VLSGHPRAAYGATDAAGEHAFADDIARPETIEHSALEDAAVFASDSSAARYLRLGVTNPHPLALASALLEHDVMMGVTKDGHSDRSGTRRSIGGSPLKVSWPVGGKTPSDR